MGTTFTQLGGFLGWAPAKPVRYSSIPKSKGWKKGKSKKKKTWRERERLRRKRITGLIRVGGALKKQPARFITLLFDKKVNRHWEISECQNRFTKFRRWLERTYPDCWFIFVMEFREKSGPHYHLLGRFGQKIAKTVVCEKWMKVTGTKWKKAAKIDPYLPEKHRSYVTTPRKSAGTHKLMIELGQKSFWGCIHRQTKMPLFRERQFTLSDSQSTAFFVVLGFLLHKQGCSKKDLQRLLKRKGCSGFCTPQMIREAYDYALRLDEAWS